MTWLSRLFFTSTAVALASLTAASCVGGLTGGEVAADAGATVDAGAGDVAAPPAEGFVLALTPAHVTADPGDAPTPVTVTVRRAVGFDERVSFQITGGVVGASASTPPDVEGAGTTTTFTVGLMAGATAKGDHEFVVRGVAQGGKTATVALGLRAGSVLTPDSQGEIVVPAFATAVDVAAWGGGGGAGAGYNPKVWFSGGAGGFASGRFPVTPGAVLVVEVGGAGSSGAAQGTGGGGGGYSAVRVASEYLLVAGGGGGGAFSDASAVAGPGGLGGGLKGGTTGAGCGGGGGGTETAGGAGGVCNGAQFRAGAAGGPRKGGDAYNAKATAARAAGGGGAGGYLGGAGCGGGGGGAYGGGGGACDTNSGGGGGGSSMVAQSGKDPKRVGGSGTSPPETSHPDYAPGVAVGGAAVPDPAASNPGGPGRVVVRLTKP